jgi:uncharacterized protein YqeY
MKRRDMKTIHPIKSLLAAHRDLSKEALRKNPGLATAYFESNQFLAPIIHKEIAKRRESLVLFREYQRTDLADREEYQISVMERYLRQPQVTEEQIQWWTKMALTVLRESGKGFSDPGNMSLKRIFEWFRMNDVAKDALNPELADQNMVKRVVVEIVKVLSDQPDVHVHSEVRHEKDREEDGLTKDRYQ